MNTDDERREHSRKKQEKTDENKLKPNTGDANANLVCKYEPNDLDELKRENSLRFCYKNSKSIGNLFENSKVKCIKYVKKDDPNDIVETTGKTSNKELDFFKKIKQEQNIKASDKKQCPCVEKLKKKNTKSHYTIRRGPTQISHLLIQDSIVSKTADIDNTNREDYRNSFSDKNINFYIDDDI